MFPHQAVDILRRNTRTGRHRYWAEQPPVADILAAFRDRLVGYRQVTDAYLLGLARYHGGALASLDRGLESLAGDSHRQVLEVVAAERV